MLLSPLVLSLSITPALAQDTGHFLAPGTPMAGADGANSHWLNPANLGFDPDDSAATFIRSFASDDWTYAAASGSGSASFGVIHHRLGNGDRWWSLGWAQGIELDKKFHLGASGQFNWFTGEERAFVMDFGFSYRPTSWLGLAGVARNAVGQSDLSPLTYTTGLVLRPAGDLFQIGVDHSFDPPSDNELLDTFLAGRTIANVAVNPIGGFVLRAHVDQELNYGIGFELHAGGAGFGMFSNNPQNITGNDGLLDDVTYGFHTSQPFQGAAVPQKDKVPYFNLSKNYSYQPIDGPFDQKGSSYLDLLRRLRNTADDPNVEVIALTVSDTSFNFAQAQEIKKVLLTARDNGKKLVAHLGDNPSQRDYFLASGCNEITMHPGGNLWFTGVGVERQYFAGALALAGVEAQFSKQGEYKSAVETYTRTGASEKATEQTEALLDDLWTNLVAGIAHGREVSEEKVTVAIDGGPMTAEAAIAGGWVDKTLFTSDFLSHVKTHQGGAEEFNREAGEVQFDHSGWEPTDTIAVVYVAGTIMPGKSARPGLLQAGNAGALSIASALRQAKKDDEVQAVVLRVDSPGGSALASEDIWKAVKEVKAAGKPVVVSMGGVAASGGYYIAAPADAILAEPTTITGSIGAFAGFLSFGDLFEKVGITTEYNGRGRMANMMSISKKMDPIEWARFDELAQDTYKRFVEKVAEGRNMSVEDVEKVASGRVWSGEDALEQGLVDQLGGFEEAISLAAEKAGITEKYEVLTFGPDLKADLKEGLVQSVLGEDNVDFELPAPLQEMMRYEGLMNEHLFMMLPYNLEVH